MSIAFQSPSVSAELIDQFQNDGYIALQHVLSDGELTAARAAISEVIDRYAFRDNPDGYIAEGSGKGAQGGWRFGNRNSPFFYHTEVGYEPSPEHRDEVEQWVRKLMNMVDEHPVFTSVAHGHPRIQPVIDAILGPDAHLFQSMALIKPANHGSEKPWHQDNAYFEVTPLDAVIGVWIALDDATVENGCMHVIPGGHRLGAMKHYHTTDCEIENKRFDTSAAVPVEIPDGGAMVFYGMLPHFTPPNRSSKRRRAMQNHYHSASASKRPVDEYDRVFADIDGRAASCQAARDAGV